MTIIEHIRIATEQTQEEVAKNAGVTLATYKKIEREGLNDRSHAITGRMIADALCVSYGVLWHFSKQMRLGFKYEQ